MFLTLVDKTVNMLDVYLFNLGCLLGAGTVMGHVCVDDAGV